MINSIQKGKVGEREFAEYLRSKGYKARRGQQFCGSPDSPDVITDCPFHFEVKRVEHLNIDKAMLQSKNECGNLPPLVAHRKNGGEWLITMTAEDFFKLL